MYCCFCCCCSKRIYLKYCWEEEITELQQQPLMPDALHFTSLHWLTDSTECQKVKKRRWKRDWCRRIKLNWIRIESEIETLNVSTFKMIQNRSVLFSIFDLVLVYRKKDFSEREKDSKFNLAGLSRVSFLSFFFLCFPSHISTSKKAYPKRKTMHRKNNRIYNCHFLRLVHHWALLPHQIFLVFLTSRSINNLHESSYNSSSTVES